jgi:hypothetical protein
MEVMVETADCEGDASSVPNILQVQPRDLVRENAQWLDKKDECAVKREKKKKAKTHKSLQMFCNIEKAKNKIAEADPM